MYKVRAATVGNPDFRQYAPIAGPATIEAATLDELRARVRGYMDYHQVGGGNWTSPPVFCDGKKIGNMSFNLRVWRGETVVDEPTKGWDVIEWQEPSDEEYMQTQYRRICRKKTVIKLKGDNALTYHTYNRPYTAQLAARIRASEPDLIEIVNERFIEVTQ